MVFAGAIGAMSTGIDKSEGFVLIRSVRPQAIHKEDKSRFSTAPVDEFHNHHSLCLARFLEIAQIHPADLNHKSLQVSQFVDAMARNNSVRKQRLCNRNTCNTNRNESADIGMDASDSVVGSQHGSQRHHMLILSQGSIHILDLSEERRIFVPAMADCETEIVVPIHHLGFPVYTRSDRDNERLCERVVSTSCTLMIQRTLHRSTVGRELCEAP
jgi:hypothetical protein